jgi:hypothetical protein
MPRPAHVRASRDRPARSSGDSRAAARPP